MPSWDSLRIVAVPALSAEGGVAIKFPMVLDTSDKRRFYYTLQAIETEQPEISPVDEVPEGLEDGWLIGVSDWPVDSGKLLVVTGERFRRVLALTGLTDPFVWTQFQTSSQLVNWVAYETRGAIDVWRKYGIQYLLTWARKQLLRFHQSERELRDPRELLLQAEEAARMVRWLSNEGSDQRNKMYAVHGLVLEELEQFTSRQNGALADARHREFKYDPANSHWAEIRRLRERLYGVSEFDPPVDPSEA